MWYKCRCVFTLCLSVLSATSRWCVSLSYGLACLWESSWRGFDRFLLLSLHIQKLSKDITEQTEQLTHPALTFFLTNLIFFIPTPFLTLMMDPAYESVCSESWTNTPKVKQYNLILFPFLKSFFWPHSVHYYLCIEHRRSRSVSSVLTLIFWVALSVRVPQSAKLCLIRGVAPNLGFKALTSSLTNTVSGRIDG